ncbi:MAG: hypothetical protein HRU09_16110 [Oligoflexales bacterium]|nr:hypothetical protein [Oligoflexales bacterium]
MIWTFASSAKRSLEKKVARIYHSFGADYTSPARKIHFDEPDFPCEHSACSEDLLENKMLSSISWEKFFWVHWLETISENGVNKKNIKNFLNKFIIKRFSELWQDAGVERMSPLEIYKLIMTNPVDISFPRFRLEEQNKAILIEASDN